MLFIEREWYLSEAEDFTKYVAPKLVDRRWAVPAYGWYRDDESRQPVVGGWFIMEATHE